MDESEAVSIDLHQPLRQSFEVRRRRYNGETALVVHNGVYVLTDIADQVWRHTVDGRSFVEIIEAVADRLDADRASTVAAAMGVLEELMTLGFVVPRPQERGGADDEPQTGG